MKTLLQDLRYGLRVLSAAPAFTAAAVVCLALGIGATSAIFTVVHAVVVKPLPYREPDRLVRVYSEFPTFPNGGLRRFWISPPEFLDLTRETKSWESLDAWTVGGSNVSGGNEPVRVTSCSLSGGLLASLGVAPLAGRVLTPQDDAHGAPLTTVLSYGLWQRAFGSSTAIVGRDIQVNGRAATVIGVMPKGFQFPPGEIDTPELWVPLQINPASPGGRGSHFLYLLGRLKPANSGRQAGEELDRLAGHWGSTAAQNTHAFHPKNHPIVSYALHGEVVGAVRPALLTLLAAVACVLLIACVNVANLLLARAEARGREIAIRRAMGAQVSRLVRQFVTEGLLLSLLGSGLGLLLASAGLRLIVAAGRDSIPRAAEIAIDGRVLLFTLATSLATGLFFGLAPLAQLLARNPHEALKSATGRATTGSGAQLFRRALVVGELALALVLLIGTGLLIRTFWKLQEVDTGLRAERLLTMRIALPAAPYPDGNSLLRFWSALQDRAGSLPGVQSATFGSGLPPVRRIDANDTQIEGFVRKPGGPLQNIDYWQTVGHRYFETLGIRLIEGRFFDERDGENAPAAVVINQTMARTYWPGESALGRRIRPGFRDPWRTIVGVVGDVKNAGLDKAAGTELYLPYRQLAQAGFGLRGGFLVLRTQGDASKMISAARGEIRVLDAALPVSAVRTMDDVLLAARSRPRFLSLLLSLFSTTALVLAAVGIYGVISYAVARRTGEIGVRMAMGAQPHNVLAMVLGQGLRLGLLGLVLGAGGAMALTGLLRGLLFGVGSFDLATFLAMGGALLAVTLAACYLPARRASRIDPMVALRYE